MNEIKLADKPSDLLEQAMEDLEKTEKSEKYKVDMGLWHRTIDEDDVRYSSEDYKKEDIGRCAICLAGSTMACRLGIAHDISASPSDFDNSIKYKLMALDSFRVGSIEDALGWLGKSDYAEFLSDLPDFIDVTPYESDKEAFKRNMKEIVEMLRKVDL